DDPAQVARDGVAAMLAGKDDAVVGSTVRNTLMSRGANALPEQAKAATQARLTKPDDEPTRGHPPAACDPHRPPGARTPSTGHATSGAGEGRSGTARSACGAPLDAGDVAWGPVRLPDRLARWGP